MALVKYTNEYSRLKCVALYRPRPDEIYQGNPHDVMYSQKPDQKKVLAEFDSVINKLEKLGVHVVVLEDTSSTYSRTPNMIYLRDVAATIDDKFILASMKFDTRKEEPNKFKMLFKKKLSSTDVAFEEIPDKQNMEGADILVTSGTSILAYTGYRTSISGLKKLCKNLNISVTTIPANIFNIPQHLLGAMHIISPRHIIRRPQYCGYELNNFKYIDLAETDEIKKGFAMNIITISPMEVLMPADCPDTQMILEQNGVKCHVIPIREIHKMGGGLACMTLPLEREEL